MSRILLAAALWGLLGPASAVVMRHGVSPLEIAFWRAAIAALLFGLHAAARRRLGVARGDVPVVAAFGLVGISLFYGSYLLAVRDGGAALAAVLLYTAPAWVALMARVTLGERIGPRRALAVGLTLGGVALVSLAPAAGGADDAAGAPLRAGAAAIGWGLVAGWSYALHYLFGRRYFARYETPTIFALALPVGAIGLLPFVTFAPKSAAAWAAILFVAVVPTYGAYLLYAAGLRRVEATRAATVATVEPVVAALAAWAALGERLAPLAALGGAVVLGGVLLAARATPAPPARPAPPPAPRPASGA